MNHLQKKKKKQELEKNRLNLAINWTGGSVLCCFIMPFVMKDYWFLVSIFIVCAILGLPFIFWASSGLKKVNQEIEKLEKKKRNLRNSIR